MMYYFNGHRRILSAFLLFVLYVVVAIQLVTNTSIPTNLTESCTSALLNDVNCSPVVTALRIGSYYPQSTLNSTCIAQYASALSGYQSAVVAACGEQTWSGYEDTVMPLAVIPDILRYLYNLTCLMDSNRYCNSVAAEAVFALDSESMIPVLCMPPVC